MDNEQKPQEVSQPENVKSEKTTHVEKSSLQQWPANSLEEACLRRYGDRERFMVFFNPDRQNYFCQPRFIDYIFCGVAPEMNVVERAYGRGCLESWLMIQLADLNEWLSPQERFSTRQLEQAAGIIANQFAQLKISEFMYFMQRVKAGHYGHFYGHPDLLRLTAALQEFVKYKMRMTDIIERERKRK